MATKEKFRAVRKAIDDGGKLDKRLRAIESFIGEARETLRKSAEEWNAATMGLVCLSKAAGCEDKFREELEKAVEAQNAKVQP